VNGLQNCLILWRLNPGWNLSYHNGMLGEWEDHVVKVGSLTGGNNNWIWVGWRKLEWSLSNAPNSTKKRGGKNKQGSSLSFSPHIVCCLYSLVQRNFNKGVKGGRFGHFLLQLSLSLESHFLPPTLNLCFCKACKSLHEKGFNILPQGNF